MTAKRTMGAALAALIMASSFALGAGTRYALALFTDAEAAAATVTTAASFAGTIYYLHNNPTPPTGDTTSQANLPLTAAAPTAATLYNYDTDRDLSTGRLITRGATGAGDTNLTRYQNWRTATLTSLVTITSGTVTVAFWSAMKDFGAGRRGVVTAYLRDFNTITSTYAEVANATLDVADWQGGSTAWVRKTVGISVPLYVLAIGHRLELKLVVAGTSDDDMWFAYDTTSYRSWLQLP